MKKLFLLLFVVGVISSISYSAKPTLNREAELVTRSDGTTYIQCINPGNTCAV